MFYRLVEFLNNKKNFPYYFISPLIYSYGNSAEQIYLVSGESSTTLFFGSQHSET